MVLCYNWAVYDLRALPHGVSKFPCKVSIVTIVKLQFFFTFFKALFTFILEFQAQETIHGNELLAVDPLFHKAFIYIEELAHSSRDNALWAMFTNECNARFRATSLCVVQVLLPTLLAKTDCCVVDVV